MSWRAGAPVSDDVFEFQGAAERGWTESGRSAIAALEEASRLYRGDLLPGSYDEWLLPEQERLRLRHVAVLDRLLALYGETGDHARAIAIAERLLLHDPLREDTHRSLILAHAARGDRARALRAYHACTDLLERELGVAPAAATHAAYQTALGLADAPPAERISAGGKGLVGRDHEWAALIEAWRAAATGQVQMVLLSGEAGIGKTRLVEELVQWVARQSYPVAQARSYAAEGAPAYAPAIEWLRSAALAPTISRLESSVRGELAHLLPELGDAEPRALPEAERRRRIYQAMLLAVGATERPATLVADDLQWCDRETLDLLGYLVRRSERLLVVGTARREEVDADHPLSELTIGLAAAGRFQEIELTRLDATDTAALAQEATGRALIAGERDWLFRETEGNPLFIVETLRSNWNAPREDRPSPTGPGRGSLLSPRVLAVVETRLRQLSREARELATLAATIGREFTLDLLAEAGGLDQDALVRGLDELWRRRIIRERGADAYDFSHDKIREAAYLAVSPLRRRERHLCVAQALQALRGADPAASGQIAWHFDLGGRPEEAVTWYIRAAGMAQRLSASEGVARPLRRALELLPRLPPGPERDHRELEILLPLGAALVKLEGYAGRGSVETYRRARELCGQLGRPVPPALSRALGLASIARYELETTEVLGKELLAGGERDGDQMVAVEGLYLLGVTAFWQGRLADSRRYLEEAIARYLPERTREHLALYAQDPKVVCLSRLAWTLWHLGVPERAAQLRDESLALADALADPYSRAYALWFALFPAIDLEDSVAIRRHVAAMQRLAADHNLLYLGAVVESFAGYRDTLDGAVDDGIARMEAALSDPRAAGQEFVLRPQTLLLLAHAHAAAGRHDAALRSAAEGIEFARRGAAIWAGEFYRLEAESMLARGEDDAKIEAAFRRSIELGRMQQSAWIERRAAEGLARWQMRSVTAAGSNALQTLGSQIDRP